MATGLTAPERRLRARLGALIVHSRYDSRATTAAARRKFLARFELEVDPDHKLPEPERQRRAAAARSAYFTRLRFNALRRKRSKKTKTAVASTSPAVKGAGDGT